MKRTSTLILIAALVLAISVPALALAAGGPRGGGNTAPRNDQNQTFDEPFTPQGNQFALGDYLVDAEGFCYILDENGEQQRVTAHGANGEPLYLQLQDGAYCWSDGTPARLGTQTQLSTGFGGHGKRRN
ncbi:MAG: hypothetical protein IH607_06015 [Firmicutes bacterium]|nr:hypothetical protein [Bacillota bacterium]